MSRSMPSWRSWVPWVWVVVARRAERRRDAVHAVRKFLSVNKCSVAQDAVAARRLHAVVEVARDSTRGKPLEWVPLR